MKLMNGIVTAMVTPFDSDDRIYIKGIRDLIDFLIVGGTNVLYPVGTTGEMHKISTEERKKVAEIAVDHVSGRIPVFIHVGAMNLSDTIELAKHAYQIGADGIGAVAPSFFKVTDKEMEEYYVAISRSIPDNFPLYLYNIPQCSCNDLTVDVAQKIASRCPNVVGIKYSYPDFIRTSDYININNGQFSVLHGTDRLLVALLAMKCKGTVSGVSNIYPEVFSNIYKAYMDNDIEKALKYQKKAALYCEALKNGANMAYFKAALKIRGIDAGHMRKPHLDLTDAEFKALKNELKRIDDLEL